MKIVFLTGAGISAESGISTFRDSDGLWENYPVQDVASIDGYIRNPELVIQFYNERRKQLLNVQPNAAHKLVAALQDYFDVVVITQNIDNLHEQAGSKKVIHLHGELMKATSSTNPNDPRQIQTLNADNPLIHIGDKAKDGSQLRPFIVWFGESVPQIEPAIKEVEKADVFVVVGTSLNVYPAAGLLQYTNLHTPIYLIDPKPTNVPSWMPVTVIPQKATEGMKELTRYLPESPLL
ncbi:MAG: NAD-dependent deacylase [Prevotellaceae bacterium]|nr:NAD-dependent deacylase [Candidatus Colivivens equi]